MSSVPTTLFGRSTDTYTRVDSVGTQLCDRSLAHFMAGFAGNDDGTSRIEIIFPLLNFAGILPDRPGEQVGRLFECVALSNVDDLRRSLRRDRVPEIFWRD